MTTNNDATRALEILLAYATSFDRPITAKEEIVKCEKLIRTELLKSAQVDGLVKCASDWSHHLKIHGTCIASDVVSNAIDELLQLSADNVIREERIVTPHDVLEFGGHYLIDRFEEAGWQLIAVRPPTLKESQ